jgi:hypothetical protein
VLDETKTGENGRSIDGIDEDFEKELQPAPDLGNGLVKCRIPIGQKVLATVLPSGDY